MLMDRRANRADKVWDQLKLGGHLKTNYVKNVELFLFKANCVEIVSSVNENNSNCTDFRKISIFTYLDYSPKLLLLLLDKHVSYYL